MLPYKLISNNLLKIAEYSYRTIIIEIIVKPILKIVQILVNWQISGYVQVFKIRFCINERGLESM